MKPIRLNATLRSRHGGVMLVVCAVLSAPLVVAAAVPEDKTAEAAQVASPSADAATKNAPPDAQNQKPAKAAPPSITASFGVAEIEKMVAAGVSTEVIKSYIEKAIVTRTLIPAELISLKEHKVPDEITTALLTRAAEIKAEARQARSGSMIKLRGDGRAGSAYLDPDSYEFWWYHYAYPRVLSTTYQTLYPYRNEPNSYFGFGLPVPYGSYFSVRSPRWGFSGPARGFSGSHFGFSGSRPGVSGAGYLSGPSFQSQTVRPAGFGRDTMDRRR